MSEPFSSQLDPANPKDLVGSKKLNWSVIPWNVIAKVATVMLEGALKYGRHNYRVVPIKASVYFDANLRHMTAWWEGDDITPEGTHHIDNAIATLLVARDSILRGNWEDDRPPKSNSGWLEEVNQKTSDIIEQYPDPKPSYKEK